MKESREPEDSATTGTRPSRRSFLATLAAVSTTLVSPAIARAAQDRRLLQGRFVRCEIPADVPQQGAVSNRGHVVRGRHAHYVLNDEGALLWALCDGRRTGAEMARTLSEAAGISHKRAERDTAHFLEGLIHAGLALML